MSKESAHIKPVELAGQEPGRFHAIGNFVTNHLRHGAAIGASAIALFGANSEIRNTEAYGQTSTPEADSQARLLQPMRAMKRVYAYHVMRYNRPGDISLQRQIVSSAHMLTSGKCAGSNAEYFTKSIDDTPQGLGVVYCNGEKRSIPRSGLVEKEVDYKPILSKIGKTAARSAKIADTMHGNAYYMIANRDKLTLHYGKNPATEATAKQLKTLTIKKGRKYPIKTWHPVTK